MEDGGTPNPRKRARENETESQKIKREKAAERQRRKRERDRANAQTQAPVEPQEVQAYVHPPPVQEVLVNAAGMGMLYAPPDPQLHIQHAIHLVHAQALSMPTNLNGYHQEPPPLPTQVAPPTPVSNLTREEQDRREKVRTAARERQRKHRALVRDRKMRDMGLDPNGAGSDVSVSVDDTLRYPTDFMHSDIPMPLMEPPFPGVAQGLGGQTFASTLLLSFSCAPLLKAHLLRTLNMTNEELASLEPVIAEAWDRWNSQRSIQYAEAQRQAHAQAQAQAQAHAQAHAQVHAQAQLQQQQQPSAMTAAFTVDAQPPPQQQQQPPQPPPQPQQPQPQHQAPPVQAPTQPTQPQPQAPIHPPPPTFAHTNGPDISSLDFRHRFTRQLTRPVPTFSPTFGDGANAIPADAIDPHLTNGTAGKS